jgi:hypothetical protein
MTFPKLLSRLLFMASAVVVLHGCDKASPVAPEGSTLTLTANPSQVTSATGTATITAIARKPNGTPIIRGTEVRFSTNLGTIDPIAETDDQGIARATLRGDGRFGKATVSAQVGTAASTAPTVDVEIGVSSASIVLQPSPTNIGVTGGTVNLVALVRDSRGQPMAGAPVNFLTELGRLSSGGRILTADASGQARDTLILTEADVASIRSSTFNVTAQTTKGDGSLLSATFPIAVDSARPVAAFSVSSAGNFSVNFTNESRGGNGTALTYQWTFGDGQSSTESSPTHQYPRAVDTYTVTLRASASGQGDDIESKTIQVQENSVSVTSSN